MECLLLMFTVCLLLQFAVSQELHPNLSPGDPPIIFTKTVFGVRFVRSIFSPQVLQEGDNRKASSFKAPAKEDTERHKHLQISDAYFDIQCVPPQQRMSCASFSSPWLATGGFRTEVKTCHSAIQMEGYGSRIVDETHPQIVLNTPHNIQIKRLWFPLCVCVVTASTLFPLCFLCASIPLPCTVLQRRIFRSSKLLWAGWPAIWAATSWILADLKSMPRSICSARAAEETNSRRFSQGMEVKILFRDVFFGKGKASNHLV